MTLANRTRFYLVALVVLGGFGAVAARLWAIQIDRYEEYSKKVPGTSEVTVRIPGVRGLIRDRRGRVLVDNVARYEMRFNLKDILGAFKEKIAVENREIATANRTATEKRPLRKVPTGRFKVGGKMKVEDDIFAVAEEMVFPRLNELGLYQEFNAASLQVHWRTHGGLVPYTYRDDLSFEDYAIAAEFSLDLPGVTVAARPLRRYIDGSLASHILGYVNQPDIDKVPPEEREQWDYFVPDDYGADGIEKTQDALLRGRPGKRVLLKDEKGRIVDSKDEAGEIIGQISYDPPQSGADLWLSIDRDYQFIVEQAMRESGIGRGAAVVIAPSTYEREIGGKKDKHTVYAGDVLAMVSVPSYDPNRFIPSISAEEYRIYTDDKTDPFINRALKDHAPGSTFKLPVALAGCLAGIDRGYFSCQGGAGYGNAYFKCWLHGKGYTHGSIRGRQAIMHSCNGYFYRMGNAAGIRKIQEICGLMGLGSRTGIPLLDEDPGMVPNPEQKRSYGLGRWGSADTAQVSIGQHQVEATPLQMAMVTATISNGGKSYKPRLIHKVIEGGVDQSEGTEPVLLQNLLEMGITKAQIDEIRGGMWDVVNKAGGTARRARSEITQISGKTGTAQTGRKRADDPTENETNAWFVAFAPYDDPKLAVCIMAENGKAGGVVGAPVAKKIIDEILSVDKFGYAPEVTRLAEAKGSFDFVELVSFDSNPADAFVSDDEADVGAVAAASTPAPKPKRTVSRAKRPKKPAPTIRKAPDKRGSGTPAAPQPKERKARRGILNRVFGR